MRPSGLHIEAPFQIFKKHFIKIHWSGKQQSYSEGSCPKVKGERARVMKARVRYKNPRQLFSAETSQGWLSSGSLEET